MMPVLGSIEQVIFDLSSALRVPVLIAVMVALALVIVEFGALCVELAKRRRRVSPAALETAAAAAVKATGSGADADLPVIVAPIATSSDAGTALTLIASQAGQPHADSRIAKVLADFDLGSLRRLDRTRLLVRVGPALGLMGTLIPLSPALNALANGNTKQLSNDLRVAFSITVLGLFIGAVAFGISLVRDRIYAQDLSDLEFFAASLGAGAEVGAG